MRAVSVMQQLQRPTTERVLLADLHVELQSLLSLLRNWQADQLVYNMHNFHRNYFSQSWGVYYTRTDQAASFSEVTKETAVQREGQLIALAQL